jgi:hypothetical protein
LSWAALPFLIAPGKAQAAQLFAALLKRIKPDPDLRARFGKADSPDGSTQGRRFSARPRSGLALFLPDLVVGVKEITGPVCLSDPYYVVGNALIEVIPTLPR